MRYFSNPDISQALVDITDEAFNLEAGKICFENGELQDIKSAPTYPVFEASGVRTVIRPIVGFIVLPYNAYRIVSNGLMSKLIVMSEQYLVKAGQSHLGGYVALERGGSETKHSTMLKSRTTARNSVEIVTIDRYERRIVNWDRNSTIDLVGLDRFLWVLMEHHNLVECLSSDMMYKFINPACEISWIIYDPESLMRFTDKQTYYDNITLRDYGLFQNCQSISCFGVTTPGLSSGEDNDFSILGDNLSKIAKSLNIPEYIPGWTDTLPHYFPNILYSKTQRMSVELIRFRKHDQFFKNYYQGNRSAKKRQEHITKMCSINNLLTPVYLINIEDVKLDDDICVFCGIPLYGPIYLLFPSSASNKCKAICPACVHRDGMLETQMYLSSCPYISIFKDIEEYGRSTWNRSFAEVVSSFTMPDIYRRILLSFHDNPVEIHDSITRTTLILPDLEKNMKLLEKSEPVTIFAGYSGTPESLYKFMYSVFNDTIPFFRTQEALRDYIRRACLIRLTLIE